MVRNFRFVAVLGLLLAVAGCKAELYSGMSEREANEMVAALLTAGIPASKSAGAEGQSIMVDDARFADAMAVLDARGLPARQYASMGDVFQKEGLVSSPTEERARMIYALSQELSRTIAEIDGVLSARIHVVLPESDMLGRDVKPSSASVFVRYAPGSNVQDYSAQIKLLVANSIEGLLYDNITVVMVPAAASEQQVAPVEFVNSGGLWLHPGSVQRFRLMMGGMLVVTFAALALAALPFVRSRLAQRKRTGAAPQPTVDESGL